MTLTLYAGPHPVAEYVVAPDLDPTLAPRPYLHPVRTLAGTIVTEVLPEDHVWHLGVSLAMPDVNGTNLWGGRSYVHGQGYVWRPDHGRIVAADGKLLWLSPSGAPLLVEDRALHADETGDGRGWRLTFAFTLTNPNDEPVELRSPATNGRGDGAGYGGFFWRLPPLAHTRIAAGPLRTEQEINGSAESPLTLDATIDDAPVTLTFSGLQDADRWFVRLAEYPAVGIALAFHRPLAIAPAASLTRRYQVTVSDSPHPA
jgi:methane monooxygenase PmoA-like